MHGDRVSGATTAVSPPVMGDIAIYLCRDPFDFRLGINGLSVMVEATLKYDAFSRNLFAFVNKRRNRVT
jgi:transposase